MENTTISALCSQNCPAKSAKGLERSAETLRQAIARLAI